MSKKYELTNTTKEINGSKVYQIRALKDFGGVKTGDLGGWIEKESNLSHEGNAWVYGNAKVYDNSKVYCNAIVYGNAWVSGNAKVYGNARVHGDARVHGNARVHGKDDIFWISNIGSEGDTLTAYLDKDNNILITRGCFIGTIEEFEKAVEKTHGNNKYGEFYKMLIPLITLKLKS